jgi:aspartate aminotransferase
VEDHTIIEGRLAQRVVRMGESETLKMAQKARELSALGHKVINLSLGEPDLKHLNTFVMQR